MKDSPAPPPPAAWEVEAISTTPLPGLIAPFSEVNNKNAPRKKKENNSSKEYLPGEKSRSLHRRSPEEEWGIFV
jgi:hypothetical protein